MINCHIDATSPRDPLIDHPDEGLDYRRLPRKVAVARGAGVSSPHAPETRLSQDLCGPRWGDRATRARPPPVISVGAFCRPK